MGWGAAAHPSQLNTCDVIISRFDKTNTVIDEDFGQPVGMTERLVDVTVSGQVAIGEMTDVDMEGSGGVDRSSGHIVFDKSVLDDSSVTIAPGDKISSLCGVTVDYIITGVSNESPLNGVFLLTVVEFSEDYEDEASV